MNYLERDPVSRQQAQTSLDVAVLRYPPKPCDSERRKAFCDCIECPIPSGWPRRPPFPLVCDMNFYAGLSNDALFFIFYFQEGSQGQVMAARALKSKNWRLHKQGKIWYLRIDEPKVINQEFERGNYRYWDVPSWSEKVKNDFTFEYHYLENDDLNRWPYVMDQRGLMNMTTSTKILSKEDVMD